MKIKILVVLGAMAPRELAENELELSLSVGKENARKTMDVLCMECYRFVGSFGMFDGIRSLEFF